MVKLKSIVAIAVIGVSLIASCKKEAEPRVTFQPNQNDAYVKILHFAPSFRNIFSNRDSFNVFIGAKKVNGAFLTYNSIFPNNTFYTAIPSGKQLFRFSVNGVLTPDSISLLSFVKPLTGGKYYSLIITDSINSANEGKQMFLEDNFTVPASGEYNLRFVHAVHNDTAAGRTVDLFSVKNKRNVFANVPAGSSTGFLNLPVSPISGGDTLILRRSGTAFEISRINGIAQSNGRVYTVVYKGSAATTGTKGRTLATYLNL